MKFKVRKLEAPRRMPPLKHDRDPSRSAAIAWLVTQPEILTMIWDRVRHSGTIAFDAAAGTWSGIDTPAAGTPGTAKPQNWRF